MATQADILLKGTNAARLALTLDTNQEGVHFFESDTLKTYRWDGSAWDLIADASAVGANFIKKDGSVAFTGDQSMGGNQLTNVGDPGSAQDAATKNYVDGLAANLGKRARVRAATTANITIATALNNGDSLDGVTLATGDWVLVKDQSAAEENGVYEVGVSPARVSEFDTYNEHPGSLIAVQEGTVNADTAWLCTSNVGGTIGVTAINFSSLGTGSVSDAAYDATTWNGDTTNAPSKNAIRDKIESMSASSTWTQVVDEDGSSFANWTSGGGTWSSDGTQIKQTDTGASHRTAYLTAVKQLAPGFVFEAQIKAVSTGAGALHLIGLVIGYDGSPTGDGAMVELRDNGGTETIRFERYATTDLLAITQAWNEDTFYTLRIVSSGGMLTAYLDGVLIGTAGDTPAGVGDARYIGLCSYGCEAHFKNIKGWAMALPA